MNRTSLPVALLVGVGTYLVLELLAGSYGVFSYRSLLGHAAEARIQLDAVALRASELRALERSLTADPETIRVEARDVGLVGRDEVVIRIAGRDRRSMHRYVPGQLPLPVPQPSDRRPFHRGLALAVALAYLLVDLVASRPTASGRRGAAPDESDPIEG